MDINPSNIEKLLKWKWKRLLVRIYRLFPKMNKRLAEGKAEALGVEVESKSKAIRPLIGELLEARKSLNGTPTSLTGEVTIADEIQVRLDLTERENMNSILNMAKEEKGDTATESEQVDPDWLTRFLDEAKCVSDEDMQRILAKILAGEFETQGSTSLKTLSVLKDMSKDDVMLFQQAMKFHIDDVIFNDKAIIDCTSDFPSYFEFLSLAHLGLLQVEASLRIETTDAKEVVYVYRDSALRIRRRDGSALNLVLHVHKLTSSSIELRRFFNVQLDPQYLNAFAEYLFDKGCVLLYSTNCTLSNSRLFTMNEDIYTIDGDWTEVVLHDS